VKEAALNPKNHFGPQVLDGRSKYILMAKVGQGGMGTLHKAWQIDLNPSFSAEVDRRTPPKQ
jgi:hypothetical protein